MRKQLVYCGLIILTIVDILLLANITFYHVSASFKSSVAIFDISLCIILWAEFIYSYFKAENRKKYLKNNWISILGMLPFDFTFFLRSLRLLKLIQLIKILVLIRDTEKSVANFLHKTRLDKIILVSILFMFAATLCVRFIDSDIIVYYLMFLPFCNIILGLLCSCEYKVYQAIPR